jgi:hypothetical protein
MNTDSVWALSNFKKYVMKVAVLRRNMMSLMSLVSVDAFTLKGVGCSKIHKLLFPLNNTERLIFLTATQRVSCEVRTDLF